MKLKDLSDLLGLSPTTVSRALNGYPEVSEATRERVRRAAAENNYQPNQRAMGLATGRAMAIGHVIPVDSEYEVVNPIFGEFLAGASEVYNRYSYELLLSIATDDNEEAIYRNIASKGAVDGFIVHLPHAHDGRIDLLESLSLPYVMHGRTEGVDINRYSWIDVDNAKAFRLATERLLELGHRRIGLINGLDYFDFAQRRKAGYESALSAVGIDIDASLIFSGEMTETNGNHAASAMLERRDRPTALLVSSYVTALGVQRAAATHGLQIPDDLSIIIHDDELSYFNNVGDTPLFTATRSSVREAGRLAAEMLIGLIMKRESGPKQLLLEADLVEGLSTAPPALCATRAG